MRQKKEAAKDALNDVHDKAETKRDKAWLLWVCTGIPNMFISIAWISMPLALISMAACAVTGYQYLKMRSATSTLKKLEREADPLISDARRQRGIVLDRQREQERAEAMAKRALERSMKPVAPATEGFNVAASDLDLDQDVTVRRIKLKPREAAVAV